METKVPLEVEMEPAKNARSQPVEENFAVMFDPPQIDLSQSTGGKEEFGMVCLVCQGKAPWDGNRQSAALHQFPHDRSKCWRRKVENEGLK